ncbi:MBL fold metallo-hydrolase [Thalassospira sp. MA62]|nr:MBL fold metallo-hydrolase [Thalassospira sp. MA62]
MATNQSRIGQFIATTQSADSVDIIHLGDRHFDVIRTARPSPGRIALWHGKTDMLFSGDIVYDVPLIKDTYHANAKDYLHSMKRLCDVPVRTVHGEHFASYSDERHRETILNWLAERT